MRPVVLFFQIFTVLGLTLIGYFVMKMPLTIFWTIGLLLGLTILWGDEKIGFRWYQDSADTAGAGLITRSIFFLAVLVPLSIYVITSTQSPVGWGVIIGVMMGISWEMWALRTNARNLRERFFAFSEDMSADKLKTLVWGWTALTVFLLLVLFL